MKAYAFSLHLKHVKSTETCKNKHKQMHKKLTPANIK
uniref:Uncharacterized protein n=1 Tax=Rhizophora mucronata TaxID=61149 RepID=A0A2P2K988_RHIMU